MQGSSLREVIMTEKRGDVRAPFIFSMVGGMIAYYIGASTGTGQEFFQTYSSHGTIGVVGVIIQHILLAALAILIIRTCKRYNLSNAKECFTWFLGKYVGPAVYYYTVAFVFCTMVQLISGTGHLLKQYYDWPYYIGASLLAALCIMSVLFGFKKVIDIISKIAPLILLVMAVVFVVGLINPVDGLAQGSAIANSAEEIVKTHSSWIGSTILHHTYLILFVIPYYVSCYMFDPGASKRETYLWVILSYVLLAVVIILMVLSQIANMSVVMGKAAPNLAIATAHAPILAAILTLMIIAASFTTTAPIAVICAEYFAKAGTARYKAIGTVIVLLAFAVSFAGSYAQIINILVTVSGRVGLGVYIFAACYRAYRAIVDRKDTETTVNSPASCE